MIGPATMQEHAEHAIRTALERDAYVTTWEVSSEYFPAEIDDEDGSVAAPAYVSLTMQDMEHHSNVLGGEFTAAYGLEVEGLGVDASDYT